MPFQYISFLNPQILGSGGYAVGAANKKTKDRVQGTFVLSIVAVIAEFFLLAVTAVSINHDIRALQNEDHDVDDEVW